MGKNYYWSAKASAFYPVALEQAYKTAKSFPDDAILVEDETFKEFTSAPPAGKHRGTGSDNMPAWVDRPISDLPLTKRASILLSSARNHVRDTFICLGEPIPRTWIDYQKALIEIAEGRNTEATDLPKKPY